MVVLSSRPTIVPRRAGVKRQSPLRSVWCRGRAADHLYSGRSTRSGDGALREVPLEEGDRPLPGEPGGGLVVPRRGVVVEPVLGAGVHVHLVGDAVGL